MSTRHGKSRRPAGGLDALKDFFTAMPPDSGTALVVIQHLEPAHESRMADILSKYTAMRLPRPKMGRRCGPTASIRFPPASTFPSATAGCA
jgi:two-component system CheB/CheR fusion protein